MRSYLHGQDKAPFAAEVRSGIAACAPAPVRCTPMSDSARHEPVNPSKTSLKLQLTVKVALDSLTRGVSLRAPLVLQRPVCDAKALLVALHADGGSKRQLNITIWPLRD